ncbi:MAG: hypothetical protein KGL54_12675 [Sphingomonadales bacterium]|nr:hypothetical protein [Sphingomonadales bacterium]
MALLGAAVSAAAAATPTLPGPTLPGATLPGPALPGWLAGTWVSERGANWGETVWSAPRSTMMLGLGWNGFGREIEAWQYLRIEAQRDAGLVLVVTTRDQARVYPAAVSSDGAIEFASAEAAFPQRIRFRREGQLLMIELAQLDGSRAEHINYRPVANPAGE